MKLREALPREYYHGNTGSAADKMLDEEVVFTVDDVHWPGPHKHVHRFWSLANGKMVGWNENPSRGWSFPVLNAVGPGYNFIKKDWVRTS